MNKKEQVRLKVLEKVEKGELTGVRAAELMAVSLRQMRRLISGYRGSGITALAHGNRGRKPINTISDEKKQKVIDLAVGKYLGFNQQHFKDMLLEQEGIQLSRSTVRNILLASGIRSPRKRRPPRHRSRRERYPQEGMLLQIDASPHHWLEDRGPVFSLIAAIDDATGKVPYALFRQQEDAAGYMELMRGIITRYGIPLAVYHDRHSIFQVNPGKEASVDEQLAGKEPLTQIGRVFGELGINKIAALSPQAKGRIERLWGTFQDRLVSELRLAGITTISEANRFLLDFLDRFNSKFSISAAIPGSAYLKTGQDFDPDTIFCFKYQRSVSLDNVVKFQGQRLQILPSLERLSYARCKVEVHEALDGTLRIFYKGHYLDTCPAPFETSLARESVQVKAAKPALVRSPVRPAADHPWRRRLLPVRC